MPSGLPSFERPPVVEVVLGVQFEPLPLTTPHLGLLWQRFRDWLPSVQEQPRLPAVVERFGVKERLQSPGIALSEVWPGARAWFYNEQSGELVQVQADRFHFNWRKVSDNAEYPRYETVEERFFDAFSEFSSFLTQEGFIDPAATQCEVTYVNHIAPKPNVWTSHADAAKVVSLIADHPGGEFLSLPENLRAIFRYRIADSEEQPIGRLHVRFEPRIAVKDGTPLLLLQLDARGKPLGEGLEGVKAFFRLGREWIVRGFVDVTRPAMHRVWGKR